MKVGNFSYTADSYLERVINMFDIRSKIQKRYHGNYLHTNNTVYLLQCVEILSF